MRLPSGLLALLLLASLAAQAREGENDTAEADPIRVFYDGGDCITDVIEVEVYDRELGVWREHPQHHRVSVPSCQVEDAGQLWNELRWRCGPRQGVDPEAWRNFEVFDPDAMSRCASDQIASGARRTAITVSEPAESSVVRVAEPFVGVRGSVDVDGLVGNEYDVVLMIDRGAPQNAIAAQIAAARAFVRRLAPRLGAVRVAVLSYPSREGKEGAQRELGFSADASELDRALARIPDRSVVSPDALPGALDAALRVLESARPAARATIVLAVDGGRLDATGAPAPDDPLLRAVSRVGASGAIVYWVALGGLSPEDPALVRSALANARGTFRRVPPQAFTTAFFDAIALPVAEQVWIEAPAANAREIPAGLSAEGRFSARVPVAGGANPLVIRARTSDGDVHERRFEFTVDEALLLDAARAAERERMRAAQRKQLEVRPEAEKP